MSTVYPRSTKFPRTCCNFIYTFSMGAAVSRVVWCIVLADVASQCVTALTLPYVFMHVCNILVFIRYLSMPQLTWKICISRGGGGAARSRTSGDRSEVRLSHGNRLAMSLTIQKLVNFIIFVFEMWSPRWWTNIIKIAKMCLDCV